MKREPLPGFRDFDTSIYSHRLKLLALIRETFSLHGFLSFETPFIESLENLVGSGGGENEKMLFKILKKGEKLERALQSEKPELADSALRFDLTVPLARHAAWMIQHGQALPFKLCHIGPVWRAERNQKGRMREFIQCDIDLLGVDSLSAELQVLQAGLHALENIQATHLTLRLSDRRLLEALATSFGVKPADFQAFVIQIDKRDKMDASLFEASLTAFTPKASQLMKLLTEPATEAILLELDREVGTRLLELQSSLPVSTHIDLSLARGMGYYTGTLFECSHPSAGYSFAGGGRYDGLLSRWHKGTVPAVGLSLGFERLSSLLGEDVKHPNEGILFLPHYEGVPTEKIAQLLRAENIRCSVFPGTPSLKAQLKYAEKAKHKWVFIVGPEEFKNNQALLKNFKKGTQTTVPQKDWIETLKNINKLRAFENT